MATPYYWDAETKAQATMKSDTPDRPDDLWQLSEEKPPNPLHRDFHKITDRINYPPRVVQLTLNSSDASSRSITDMSWNLAFGQSLPFKPGTVIHFTSITYDGTQVNQVDPQTGALVQTGRAVGSRVELALGGIRMETYNTSSKGVPGALVVNHLLTDVDSFIKRTSISGQPIESSLFYNVNFQHPVSATLLELDFMTRGRIVLYNLSDQDKLFDTADITITVTIAEPGSKF